MKRCHTASGKASTDQHYGYTQLMWTTSSSCWCTVLTTLQHTPSQQRAKLSISNRLRRNNRDRVYHSLGLCGKFSLCCVGWNPGIWLEQGPVYHASCDDIFQEWWCTSLHLTVRHFWWSRAWDLFCSRAAENNHALHQGEFAPDGKCWLF